MEKNLLFFLFLVIAYAVKEFVINVKNRLITVINAVLKISAENRHHPSICEVLQTQLSGQCQYVIHVRRILNCDHQCHIQRQKNDQHNSYDKKNRYILQL